MKIISPSAYIHNPAPAEELYQQIETGGRICYQSQPKGNPVQFIRNLIARGHESPLEHAGFSAIFICDRGVSHEIVRHRVASYCQESTRYVASSKRDCTVNTEDDVLCAYNEAGLSMKRIADRSNGKYSEWDVSEILRKNGIEKRNLGSRGVIHEDYFEVIDTPEKAFLLGFIMADGNIRRNLNQLTITQKEAESWWVLNMIRDFVQPDAKTLTVHNRKICYDLFAKGVIPNKTYESTAHTIDSLWESVPEQYKPDLLRGLLDGDGSIRWFYQKPTSKTLSCNIQFAGNQYLMEKIAEYLNAQLGYKATVKPDSISETLYRVTVTDHDKGKQLCDLMYKHFKFPYGHSKTARYYEAFDLPIPISTQQAEVGEFNAVCPSIIGGKALWVWGHSMLHSEIAYKEMIECGCFPQEARSVLPNSLKTQLMMTANIREWRHFFKLRCAKDAHPQMREVALMLYKEAVERYPVLFEDLQKEFE